MKIHSVSDCKEALVIQPSLLTTYVGDLDFKLGEGQKAGETRTVCTEQLCSSPNAELQPPSLSFSCL